MSDKPLVILPQVWATDPSRGPDDAWWESNALGLQRVWPDARRCIEETARKWGLSPWLVLAKIESEQVGLSYAWDGSRVNQYKVLEELDRDNFDAEQFSAHCASLLADDGVRPLVSTCDAWSMVFLLGVDKPRASTATDIGARSDGWFGPRLQVEGCAMRFGALYTGRFSGPPGRDVVDLSLRNQGLPPLPRDLRGYTFPKDLAPGKPCTRAGVTITPANCMSCYSLAYMMSMPGQLKLRDIGLRLDPEAYAMEEAGITPAVTPPESGGKGNTVAPTKPRIVETNLQPVRELVRRSSTTRIVVHHSDSNGGNAAAFHRYHVDHNGWAMVAYHFVIHADGTIERGRPEAVKGGHTLNCNHDSIGICVVGKCDSAEPTNAQIASLTELLAWLCAKYGLAPEAIYGHRDLNSTTCPGRYLYDRLPGIRDAIRDGRAPTQTPTVQGLLRIGNSGARVRDLQASLQALGYDCGPLDGDFGTRTRAAVLAFQREHDLDPDGIVGPLTWAKLGVTA